MVYKHAVVAAFHIMLSVVKMLLKRVVGGHALSIHGNYIVDHGTIMELCFLNLCGNPELCCCTWRSHLIFTWTP